MHWNVFKIVQWQRYVIAQLHGETFWRYLNSYSDTKLKNGIDIH